MKHDTPQDSDQTPSNSKRRRYGWWLFLAFAVLLVSIALNFLVPAYRQPALIERIEAARGEVQVQTEPVGPEWLRKFLGKETMRGFDDVVWIDATDSLIDDRWLEDVSKFTSLKDLYLSNVQVSDADLLHLTGLPNLGYLHLDGTQVSDAGLAHLKGLTNLEVLQLANTQVSDAGLVHLKGLTSLRVLLLFNTQVTDDGVKELQTALPYCDIGH